MACFGLSQSRHCPSHSVLSPRFCCAGYVPIRTPARRLTATPTPLAGNATPVGFFMQKEGQTPGFQDTQPKGNLPFLKPEDAQYFDKLLVSTAVWRYGS